MDGGQGSLNPSIRRRLAWWLALTILAVALAAGTVSFRWAFEEANALQDDTLRQVSALFDPQHLPAPHLGDTGRLPGSDEDARVIVQYLPRSQPEASLGRSDDAASLPLGTGLADGIHTITIRDESFRAVVRTLASGERIVVAQETGIRNEIARDSALRTVLPFLLLVPVMLALLGVLLRRMFQPIARLAADVEERGEQDLRPLREAHIPAEIAPFVGAINRLLSRTGQAMAAQRRFVSDAAHELRTPLTALSLQAERLGHAPMSDEARERLAALRGGIERGRNLLEQLLTLSRAQAAPRGAAGTVSVQQVLRHVLEDLVPLAEARSIDLGVGWTDEGRQADDGDAQVAAGTVDLTALLRNLVDNAIRYTPPGGRVDLSAGRRGDRVILQVTDSGPGIPPAERARVFDAFYRAPGNTATGSGLGLSIVKTIAERLDAEVSLAYADEAARRGLRVTVSLPADTRGTGAAPAHR